MFKKKVTLKSKIILIILFSVILTILFSVFSSDSKEVVTSIKRPEASQTKKVNLSAEGINYKDKIDISFNVESRKLSKKEAQDILEENRAQLWDFIKGENIRQDEVRQSLNLPTTIGKYKVKCEWASSDYSLITYDGKLFNQNLVKGESRDITLVVYMTLAEASLKEEIKLKVVAPNLSELEEDSRFLKDAIKEEDVKAAGKEDFLLPKVVEGEEVTFTKTKEKVNSWIFIPLGLFLAVFLIIAERKKKEKEKAKLEEGLRQDYPSISSNLSLLCGAGITVYRAWEKIALEYAKKRKKSLGKRPGYERMLEALKMIKGGMNECQAYINFGDACALKEYKRLSSYLSEYVKKGSGDIKKLLEEDSYEAFQTKKARVGQKASEAGTRLLFPMIMMLGVVMAIVMLPAMLSINL